MTGGCPTWGGDEFYSRLVDAHDKFRGRVVFTTGDTLDSDVIRAAQKDNNSLLNKPFHLDSIREILVQMRARWEEAPVAEV